MTYPATPTTRERVSFPPGTRTGRFEDMEDPPAYLSDQDIAAGRIPKRTKTTEP